MALGSTLWTFLALLIALPVSAVAKDINPEFEALIQQSDAEWQGAHLVHEIERLWQSTDVYVQAFDEELDRAPAGALFSEAYARLLAAQAATDRMDELSNSFYLRALSDSRPGAVAALRGMKSEIELLAAGPSKIALQSWLEGLHAALPKAATRERAFLASFRFAAAGAAYPRNLRTFFRRHARGSRARLDAALVDLEVKAQVDASLPLINESYFSSSAVRASGAGDINGAAFRQGDWALTFDDGLSSSYTPNILSNLTRHSLRASFMWLAKLAPGLPAIVERARSAGASLCDHSYTHANLAQTGTAGLNHEIAESALVLQNVFGTKVRVFRCPYGACGAAGSAIHGVIGAQGMASVLWNVDSLDWHDQNPTTVYQRVMKQMSAQGRGIILFHDVHPQSVVASELVMRDIEAGQKLGVMRSITLHQAIDGASALER